TSPHITHLRPLTCGAQSAIHSYLLIRPPPTFTLFPYTTLFRSRDRRPRAHVVRGVHDAQNVADDPPQVARVSRQHVVMHQPRERSEEHTSELQSRGHLVCRLLLQKKKYYLDTQGDDDGRAHTGW